VIICINKMDLVDYVEERFEEIHDDFMKFSAKLDIQDIRFIPISALKGDNVVDRSDKMPWYNGPTLMYLLETIYIASDANHIDSRFPVQYVIRPQTKEFPDYRGYAGRIAGGSFRVGDNVVVLPSGFTSKIKTIDFFEESLEMAHTPQSVTLTLEDDIDISRGDMIVRENNQPKTDQNIDMMICWLNDRPMQLRGKYALKHTSNDARCMITDVKYKIDINTLDRDMNNKDFAMNDIGRITIRTTKPLHYDSYRKNRITGSVVLVDEGTNETVCAGMIV
jgi:sulfate adenylyltransferase subunit 1